MPFSPNRTGQIALAVRGVDRAERFYKGAPGLRKLYRYGGLTFFDCAGWLNLTGTATDHPDHPHHARGQDLPQHSECPPLPARAVVPHSSLTGR